jgi:hypothetical protein
MVREHQNPELSVLVPVWPLQKLKRIIIHDINIIGKQPIRLLIALLTTGSSLNARFLQEQNKAEKAAFFIAREIKISQK